MGKGNGEGGGALGAGGVASRSAAIAGTLLGTAIVAGAGFAMIRRAAAGRVSVNPGALTPAMAAHVLNDVGAMRNSDVLVSTMPAKGLAKAMRLPGSPVGGIRQASAGSHPAIAASIGRLAKGGTVTPVATGKQLKRAVASLTKPGPVATKGKTAGTLKKEALGRVKGRTAAQQTAAVKGLVKKLKNERGGNWKTKAAKSLTTALERVTRKRSS